MDIKPHIVHFSGHGSESGALCFENRTGETHPIYPESLSTLFDQFKNYIDCVILNACYSESQAKAIAKHINFVIGIRHTVDYKTAICFSIGFYQAIGAGCPIEEAYKLGCVQIQLSNDTIPFQPVLIKKNK